MKTENDGVLIAEEVIISKIYIIRGKQVMIAQDLAELYHVDTKALNQQAKQQEAEQKNSPDGLNHLKGK